MRKRFSLPTYTNKSLYADEQKSEFQYVVHGSSSRPQLQTKDEARLRQAVTSLYQQVDQNEEARVEQTEALSESNAATAEPGVKRTRSRRSIALDTLSSISRRLSVVVEPTENARPGNDGDFAFHQDDPFLQFNGMLYTFEFGSPISRHSRVFEASTPDAGESYSRYRPRNPAARAKKSRCSWSGFDLAHRNNGDTEDRDDLIAILEHDESNLNDAAVAAPVVAPSAPAVASSSSHIGRKPSLRRSYYQDKRRSGIVVDDARADSIAVGATVHKDSTHSSTNNNKINASASNNNNISSSENIQAFIPLGNTAEQSETLAPEKKRGIIRRVSLSLFGRRKTDPMVRNSNVHRYHANNNSIRV